MRRRDIDIEGHKFTVTELEAYGFSVGVRQWRERYDHEHFIIKTVNRVFNKHLYYFPHTPIVIDRTHSTHKFSRQSNIRVLDMPIKFPGSNDYRIPKELQQFDEVIAKMVSFEHTINPFACELYHAYLTVDQGLVPAYCHQRTVGCHANGFQGARLHKRAVARSYSVFDAISPVYYAQRFATGHLDEVTDDFFSSFDEQADEMYAITFDPYQIILTNAYTVHRSEIQDEPVYRTFVRLTYDQIKYDRLGNTHNPMFSYDWTMVPRIRKNLKHKPVPKYHPDAV